MNATITEGYLNHKVFSIVSGCAGAMGVRAFVIGGYVRDCFLGRPCKDVDIVVEGSGIELACAVAKIVRSKVSVFKNFGTAMLRYKGLEVEFVGARKESYHRDSRKPIVADGTLEDDQLRRDFTINAMAFSLCKEDFGALVDPFGGIRDLAAGIIRTPLDPDTTYSDDPLRMLRAIRFATTLSTPEHKFTIVPESLDSIRRQLDRLSILSRERIAEELNKILVCHRPSPAFVLMEQLGMLQVFLPELARLKGVETMEGKGHKENFSHTMMVLDNVSELEEEAISEGRLNDYQLEGNEWKSSVRTRPNVWLRWAALLHDIAKPRCKRFEPGVGWTFHGHEYLGGKMVPSIFASLKLPLNEKMKYVQKLVSLHLRPIALVTDDVTDSAVRRLLFDAGHDIDDLMLLCHADITSKNPRKVERLHENFKRVQQKMVLVEEKDSIRNFKNPITGDYIMEVFGIPPSREIAVIKDSIKEAILEGEIPNEWEAARERMFRKAAEMGLQPVQRDGDS